MKVDLLICKCGDCAHWEIGRSFIMCKTCGQVIEGVKLTFRHIDNLAMKIRLHTKVDWKLHER